MADKSVGIRLKQLRKDLHLTQEEAADKLGISRARYSHFENGRNEPDNELLLDMANFYNVTVDYLLGNNNTPKWANEKDTNDLQRFLNDNEGSMTYGGEDLTEEEKEKLKIAMTQIFWSRHKHD